MGFEVEYAVPYDVIVNHLASRKRRLRRVSVILEILLLSIFSSNVLAS